MEDKVKTRIKELCPDVMFSGNPVKWTITLAVVLRAIRATDKEIERKLAEDNGHPNAESQRYSHFVEVLKRNDAFWNLEQDNYDRQSEECKQFIGSLLGV